MVQGNERPVGGGQPTPPTTIPPMRGVQDAVKT